jgi:hypothetical protein
MSVVMAVLILVALAGCLQMTHNVQDARRIALQHLDDSQLRAPATGSRRAAPAGRDIPAAGLIAAPGRGWPSGLIGLPGALTAPWSA